MIKRLLKVQTLALVLLGAINAFSQTSKIAEREKQWQDYPLPSADFVRASDAGQTVMFRAPSTWQREPTELSFAGPHSSHIKVFVEKVPDGIPLGDLVASITQQLRNQPGAEDLLVRRTQISGLEAREIVLEIPDATGAMSHRVIWCTVDGPNAISLVLLAPSANLAEVEPFFKAVIQSVNLPGASLFAAFEGLRTEAIREVKPTRIDEVQQLTGTLNGFDPAVRRASIEKLGSVFATSPDAAIDLVLNRRAMVRAAAIEAIGLSKNTALSKFLFTALEDREVFVAERAARSIAAMPDAVGRLRSSSLEWQRIEPVARVWSFLTKDRRNEILREIFNPTARPNTIKPLPKRSVTPPPSSGIRVLGTVVVKGQPAATGDFANDPSLQLGGLILLRQIPASEFPLPLAQLEGTKNDTLIRAALEVGLARNERLPVEPLLRLLSSTNHEISRLAAEELGNSGSLAEVTRLEALIDQQSKVQAAKAESTVTAELRLTIKKIRLREQLAKANADEHQTIISKALADANLADWVWFNFAREQDFAGTRSVESQTSSQSRSTPSISPLAENVLPANVTLYAALPNPIASLNRMSEAFNAIQMDTARQQADLVLIMNALGRQLAAQVNAEPGATLNNYFGIDGTAPAVFARWNAENAPRGIPRGVRRAVFIRVSDRERFERLVGLYQKTAGDTAYLADYFGVGVRFLGMLPGAFPMVATSILKVKSDEPKDFTILDVGFSGTTNWNGYSIRTLEADKIDSVGHFSHDTAYLTYIGETALLTPDLDSLRDVLTRAATTKTTLAANPEFKQAANSGGDAFYFSNLREILAAPGDKDDLVAAESGSLKITKSVWENLFQLKFAESEWSRPLIRFNPVELVAPRQLLPATSFAYFISRIDAPKAWSAWNIALSAEERLIFKANWAADFEREVLPELGPECGIAVVGVPNLPGANWNVPLVVFFQLKSEKLKELFDKGLLFKGNAAKPNVTSVKLGTLEGLATIRNGFLVIANNEAALAALDDKDKLATSADFSKTLKSTPENLIAFAGLNQDAGVDAITKSVNDPEKQRQLSAILSVAKAFHSQSFYATADATGVGARFSTLIGREGRYSVAELSSLAKDQVLTFAIVEPRGVPISNQRQLKHIRLRLRTKAHGEADRVSSDISSASQLVTRKSADELEVTVQPRRYSAAKKTELPISDPAVAQYLKPTRELRADDPGVIAKAREIAGNDRDAWSVAQKLGEWTFKNLTWKRVDTADAAQTLATREADCSEFSQLYVAMARSLGLPARTVSGLAHSGSAFGGHAWVEVFIGQWIELDPTFGTDFVDATHIRDATGGLLTYAAMNLVEIDVLEAPRGVADFQLDAKALAAKLSEELANGNSSALTAALDPALLTDQEMGKGSWAAMNDTEREQMTSAYRRIVMEVVELFKGSDNSPGSVRVLRVKETGDSAEALLMHSAGVGEFLGKLTFAKAGGGWYLAEVLEAETGLKIVSDMLKPAIWQINERRNGKNGRAKVATNLVRVLIALNQDPKSAVKIADEVLKEEPNDRTVLFAKSLALAQDEKTNDAALEIWRRLSADPLPYPAAVLKLAISQSYSEKPEDQTQAVGLFEKYITLEPEDPRGHTRLASMYNEAKKPSQAEVEYRAAIATDATNSEVYLDLAEFLAAQKRYPEAVSAINEGAKHAASNEDVVASLFQNLMFSSSTEDAEHLARLLPGAMNTSSDVNLYLARMRMNANRAADALPLLRKAAELDKKSSSPWTAMSECYRSLKNWAAALSAANTAVDRDVEDPDAYYQRACAQARLGRLRDAMASLKRSIELESYMADDIENEADLKPLSSLPEFKKLLVDRDKQ